MSALPQASAVRAFTSQILRSYEGSWGCEDASTSSVLIKAIIADPSAVMAQCASVRLYCCPTPVTTTPIALGSAMAGSTRAIRSGRGCVSSFFLRSGVKTNWSRLEQAAEPENLTQEAIIGNLAPQEAARLSRVRNIGIAVSHDQFT